MGSSWQSSKHQAVVEVRLLIGWGSKFSVRSLFAHAEGTFKTNSVAELNESVVFRRRQKVFQCNHPRSIVHATHTLVTCRTAVDSNVVLFILWIFQDALKHAIQVSRLPHTGCVGHGTPYTEIQQFARKASGSALGDHIWKLKSAAVSLYGKIGALGVFVLAPEPRRVVCVLLKDGLKHVVFRGLKALQEFDAVRTSDSLVHTKAATDCFWLNVVANFARCGTRS